MHVARYLPVKLWCLCLVVAVSGCAAEPGKQPIPAPRPPDVERRDESARAPSTQTAPPVARKGSENSANPKASAEAQELLRQGLAAYHVGQYDDAENLLKRSITVYPFLAPANLALGKIFLLKGAANHDEALIQSARLMFDMAHNIDPSLREPLVLLELFKPRGN